VVIEILNIGANPIEIIPRLNGKEGKIEKKV
jgi:hypothetical protein